MQTIRKGSRGETVKQAQTLLNAKGYNCGSIDGIFGAKTEAAVKAFQQAYGLSADGIIGKNTWVALQAGASLKQGSRGDEVRELQEKLNRLGYACGTADGIFGAKTEAAVKAFQQANGLSTDGIAGPKTQAALEAASADEPQEEPKTEHFKRREFDCHNGVKVPVQYYGNLQRLMNELEKIRAIWGKPITIRSGYRTLEYNRALGNTTDHSQHLTANAADIVVKGVAASAVYKKLNEMYPNDGVGRYTDFTHIDLRGRRARW